MVQLEFSHRISGSVVLADVYLDCSQTAYGSSQHCLPTGLLQEVGKVSEDVDHSACTRMGCLLDSHDPWLVQCYDNSARSNLPALCCDNLRMRTVHSTLWTPIAVAYPDRQARSRTLLVGVLGIAKYSDVDHPPHLLVHAYDLAKGVDLKKPGLNWLLIVGVSWCLRHFCSCRTPIRRKSCLTCGCNLRRPPLQHTDSASLYRRAR